MNKFIGTKEVKARPLNLGPYNALRGWELPADENPDTEGYLVEYLDSPNKNHPDYDNYISWSPKDVFERSYRLNEYCTFGQAIEAAKQGKRVARIGWNGKGLFVFMQIPAVIKEEIIPKMQSLPQSVKDEFAKRGGSISYQNQWAIVYPDNSIHGWAPSASDALAEDWVILD